MLGFDKAWIVPVSMVPTRLSFNNIGLTRIYSIAIISTRCHLLRLELHGETVASHKDIYL